MGPFPQAKETPMSLVKEAREFAKVAHASQKRKYTGTPYADHPIRVAEEAERLGMPQAAVIAAALHDVEEDAPQFIPQMKEKFGEEVAALVHWMTNPSKGSPAIRAKRKEVDRRHLAGAPMEVKLIKALDRLDNILEMGGAQGDFRFTYAGESILLAEALVENGSSPQLDELTAQIKTEAMSLASKVATEEARFRA